MCRAIDNNREGAVMFWDGLEGPDDCGKKKSHCTLKRLDQMGKQVCPKNGLFRSLNINGKLTLI